MACLPCFPPKRAQAGPGLEPIARPVQQPPQPQAPATTQATSTAQAANTTQATNTAQATSTTSTAAAYDNTVELSALSKQGQLSPEAARREAKGEITPWEIDAPGN